MADAPTRARLPEAMLSLPGSGAEGPCAWMPGCLVEGSWERRPGRRAIDIPVRQPVAELLLFLFF